MEADYFDGAVGRVRGAGGCVSRVGFDPGGSGGDPVGEPVGVAGDGLCDSGDWRGGLCRCIRR